MAVVVCSPPLPAERVSGQQTVTVSRSTLAELTERTLTLWQQTESLKQRLETRTGEVLDLQVELQNLNAVAEKLRTDIDFWKSQSAEALAASRDLQAVLQETQSLQAASETALQDYTATFATYRAEAEAQISRLQSSVRVWRVVGLAAVVAAVVAVVVAAVR